MRKTCLKIFAFFIAFIIMQIKVMPWMMNNQMIPLWGDILMISTSLMLWVAFIDNLARKIWTH